MITALLILLGALQCALLFVKLAGFTPVSWWAILSPSWVPPVLLLGTLSAYLLAASVVNWFHERQVRRLLRANPALKTQP